jgi:hypothetical protein
MSPFSHHPTGGTTMNDDFQQWTKAELVAYAKNITALADEVIECIDIDMRYEAVLRLSNYLEDTFTQEESR